MEGKHEKEERNGRELKNEDWKERKKKIK